MPMLETLLSSDRRAAAAEEQVKLREKIGDRVIQNDPAVATFFWGQQREADALTALETDHGQEWSLARLAEGLAAQCRYAEAAQVATTATKGDYETRANAVAAMGTRLCQCPSIQLLSDPNDAKGRSFTNPRDIERVFDGERVVVFTRCSFCKTISAR